MLNFGLGLNIICNNSFDWLIYLQNITGNAGSKISAEKYNNAYCVQKAQTPAFRHQSKSQKQLANSGNLSETLVNMFLFMFNANFMWNMPFTKHV